MINEDEFFDKITEIVKMERKKRKVSQLSLALILGHQSPSYVARIELRQDNANYNLHHLLLIADEFQMDILQLIPSVLEN
ncbi:helix-turn-helix domain-containing protein [Sulfurovum sp. NBC37-1]|uniref:helix-turn-helix domain-containing protein n=1 Tax=Sulfurovum sp. (strain NBC37-1) TaxID=387093 RepID=UPI0001587986|nr:helix-turn-helix transcriptional regulator [Sulfurovum sp. NBC37-1]BAF73245.1 transcriptional regulator, Xre family [Sulfurovum sp. NBC37-1]